MDVVDAYEEKSVYATVTYVQEGGLDGVGFEVHINVGCNEEMISGVVRGLSEAVKKLGSWCGETFPGVGTVEEVEETQGTCMELTCIRGIFV